MAYADSMRSSTCTLETIATLIEGIFASTYGLTWSTWSPTYGASGAMTYTAVTSTSARYIQIGKLVFFNLDAVGTTGGVANTTLTFSLPVTCSGRNHCMGGQIYQAAGKASQVIVSSGGGSALLYDSSNLSLAASTYLRVAGIYEAA